jgi:uncharacterized phage protein gp47/JayE
MADTTGILTRLQAALTTYDPSWDVSVGSPTYKIFESVAQEIANANNNSTLQTYSYNINTKSGSDLDTFVNLFGIYRQLGKRSVGTVSFISNTPAISIINIPLGTQVAVPVGPRYTTPIYFTTTAPAIIPIGGTQTNVPVIGTLPGVFGNVPANTITAMVTTLNGVTSIANINPTTGGTDPESDAQLRSRWQATAFNNTTGTNGKYIVTALQNPNVNLANAVSSQSFYDEQLSIQATVSGGSSNVTFQMIAYSGMTNVVSGTVYSGTNIVTYSGFTSSTTGTALASGLQAMVSGVAPNYGINVTATPSGNTINQGLNIQFGGPSPYRLTIGSGNTLSASGVTGVTGSVTISGTTYTEYVRSGNPDIGAPGTLSYNPTYSGYLYPQGNELVGTSLNSASQTVYVPNSDYYYNSGGTYTVSGTFSPQLFLSIANPTNSGTMFIGNTVEVISEYNPASNRSLTITSGNYVDVFIDGTTAGIATEQVVFNPSFTLSSGNSTRYLNSGNYVLGSGGNAGTHTTTDTQGDYYIPLDRQPLINFPSQLSAASSGIADTFFLYNPTNNTGATYPICLNPYNFITFTGTVTASTYTYINVSGVTVTGSTVSGINFVSVPNANTFLAPGLALAQDGSGIIGAGTWISSVSSSGIYLSSSVSNSGTTTFSGKSIAYPIYDNTNQANSVHSMTGIVLDASTPPSGWPSQPSTPSWVQYTHNYNSDVVDVEALVQQSRPFGTNTMVHQAVFQQLSVSVRIVFSSGYSLPIVQSSILNQLQNYFNGSGYLSIISFAQIQTQIMNVAGVSNARVTSVSTTALDGTVLSTYTSDFLLPSNQLPLISNINYTIVGASTF